MKKIALSISSLLLCCIQAFAQAPTVQLVVVENTIPGAIATTIDAALLGTYPPRTFEVYAQFDSPHWELQAMYSDNIHPWSLNVTTQFYQSANGGLTANSITPAVCSFNPAACYDSFFALGSVNGSSASINYLPTASPAFVTFEAGSGFTEQTSTGASIFIAQTPPNANAITDANSRVRIGQFTTDGIICGVFNFQVRKLNSDNSIYDPAGDAPSETYQLFQIPLSAFPQGGDLGLGNSCPQNITANTDLGSCNATISNVGNLTSNQSCGATTFSNNHPSSIYPVGNTTVIWTISDGNGNSNSCSQTVTVLDNEVPTINCPANVTSTTAAGSCSSSIATAAPGYLDNCSVSKLTFSISGATSAVSPSTGINTVGTRLFNVGISTITYTVTDATGNTANCSFTVTVTDAILPTITCPANISTTTLPNICSASVATIAPTYSDNCSVVKLTYVISGSTTAISPTTGINTAGTLSFNVGITTVTYTVTDAAGNIASCSSTVTVTDTVLPSITCTENITASTQANSCSASVATIAPTYSDNCSVTKLTYVLSGATTATSPTTGINTLGTLSFNVGVTTVTYTVSDATGNVATCSFTVTVTDSILPTIICPANISVNVGAGLCSATINNLGTPVTTDNCTVASVTNNHPSSTFNVGITTVVWTVTDASGNSSSCNQTITVSDNILPTITCPVNITAIADPGSCTATILSLGTPITADNCAVASVTNNHPSATFASGTTTVIWTVTDINNNSATCSQTVTVTDNILPSITCPANITASTQANSCSASVATIAPTYSDNCSVAKLTFVLSGATTATSPTTGINTVGTLSFNVGITTVTYTVTDAAGNLATCSFTVTVTDTTLPTITCPANISVNVGAGLCSANINNLGTPVTTDNCTIASVTNNHPSTSFNVGTTTVVWTVTDASGNSATCNQTITVSDTILPTITCPANITASADPGSCTATVLSLGTPITADNCAVASVTNNHPSATFASGTTTVIWTVTDINNNSATCSQAVTVTDNILPSITCPANITASTQANSCSASVATIAPTYSDNCSVTKLTYVLSGATTATSPTTGINTIGTLSFNVGVTTVTYTVSDAAGNLATCSYTATVTDTILPTIICPANITSYTLPNICSATVNTTTPAYADNCSVAKLTYVLSGATTATSPAIGINTLGALSFNIGVTTVTYTVTDAAGNTANCSFTVTVADNVPPVISCPQAIVQPNDALLNTAYINVPLALASDNCSGYSITNSFNTSGANASGTYPLGITSLTYTATDANGNQSTCSTTIIVTDVNGPLVECPSNISTTSDATQCGALVTIAPPNVLDASSIASITNSFNGTSNASGFYNAGTTQITWTVIDNNGNTGYCAMSVIVIDVTLPEITCPPTVVQSSSPSSCYAQVNTPSPIAVDGCGISQITNSYSNNGVNASGIYNVGTTTVVYTVIDVNGNQNTCSQNITIVDDVQPTISCPSNISINVNLGSCFGTVLNLGTPIVSDNCSVASFTNDQALSAFPIGNTSVVWTVIDASSNTSTCVQTVTVIDNINPVISCPQSLTSNSSNTNCASTLNISSPLFSDNCNVNTLTYTLNGATNSSSPTSGIHVLGLTDFNVGTTTITYSALDVQQNLSQCTFEVTVTDNINPSIICPSTTDVSTSPNICSAVFLPTAPVYSDNCSISSLSYVLTGATATASASTGINTLGTTTFNVGTTFLTYTVIDVSGNSNTCSSSIVVTDVQLPSINCPTDITQAVDFGLTTALVNLPSLVASDNCGIATITNDFNNNGANASGIFNVGTTTVTFTVTDINGNISTCFLHVTVTDGQSPVINCPNSITQNVDAGQCGAFVQMSAPIATDNGSIVSLSNDFNGTSNASGFYPTGTTTVTWTAVDNTGISVSCAVEVTITDNINPSIICPSTTSVSTSPNECSATISPAAPVYSDNCSISSLSYVLTGATATASASTGINTLGTTTFNAGTTLLTYTVVDGSGNSNTCSSSIVVTDVQSPSINCPTDITQAVDVGLTTALVTLPSLVASDNCGIANITNDFNNNGPNASGIFNVGTTTVTFTVTDINGNISTCFLHVTVTDGQSPVINCPNNITQNNDAGQCGAFVQMSTPVATDNGSIVSLSNDFNGTSNASGFYPTGTSTVTWTAVDNTGISVSCAVEVTILDNTPPVILCIDSILVNNDLGLCGAQLTLPPPTAIDNCGIASITNDFSENTSAFLPVGLTAINWTVTDSSGNLSSCITIVEVNDVEIPTIQCATPAFIVPNDPGQCGAAITYALPSYSDNCATPQLSMTSGYASGSVFPIGTTTVTFEVIDNSGNSNTCSIEITVQDIEPSVLDCPSNLTVLCEENTCGANVTFVLPSFHDNCTSAQITQTLGPVSGTFFEIGETPISFQAITSNADTLFCNFTVTVIDQQVPVISCPEDIFQENPIAFFDAPTFSDNCNASITQTSGPSSGDVFPHGNTLVSFSVADASGNTAVCSFSVTIDSAPIANPDSILFTGQEEIVVISPLDNDLDNDGDPLIITNAICHHGAVTISANGTLNYSIDPTAFCGFDSISYTVCDTYGLCDSSFVVVEVTCPVEIILPQGMSPNGDGINDVLEFIGLEDFAENKLVVFNRWGHIVFEAKNYDNTWNGVSQSPLTLGNSTLPNGTYYYFLTLPDQKSLNGFFYLDR